MDADDSFHLRPTTGDMAAMHYISQEDGRTCKLPENPLCLPACLPPFELPLLQEQVSKSPIATGGHIAIGLCSKSALLQGSCWMGPVQEFLASISQA